MRCVALFLCLSGIASATQDCKHQSGVASATHACKLQSDASLLQTTSGLKRVKKSSETDSAFEGKKWDVHRVRINVHDSGVSLLEGKDESANGVVYTACAPNDAGN